jgi:hypothetical protein
MKKMKKMEKMWVDGEALHFVVLRGELKLEFGKNAKNKVNFIITHLFYFSTLKPHLGMSTQFDFEFGNLQQIRDYFSQKIIFKLGKLHILKALAFVSCTCTLFPDSPSFIWPLWGLNLHFLGGRERS